MVSPPAIQHSLARAATERTPSSPGARHFPAALAGAARVAVVTKFRFMGDTVVATPFLAQLRAHFPQARVTLLTSPSAAVALAGCPHLDEIVPLDYGRGRLGVSIAQWRLLRGGRFEAAFLLNRSFDCALMGALARVPFRVGYATDGRGPLLGVRVPYALDRHEADAHLDLLRALDLPAAPALPRLWFTNAENTQAEETLKKAGWDGRRLLIGVQPGANDPGIREWGAERFAQAADALADETGGQIALMGGPSEKDTARRTARAMRHTPLDLVGRLPLREALAAIGRCGLWLGNDSGLLHAAVGCRVPSVGVFGPNKVGRWGYDTPRHHSLAAFPNESAHDDAAVRRALDLVTEAQMIEAARAALSAPPDERWPDRDTPWFVPPAETRPTTRRR